MSRSNRTLRQANAAYRALRQETQALVRRAETALITAIILYKLLTELVFLPAMRGIWSLTLRVSPVNYLTNTNAHQIFTAPSILSGIALIAILVALWNLYEFSIVLHGLDRARRGEPSGLPALFRVSLADIRHVLHPKNWPILLYCVLLIPFTDMYVTASYITPYPELNVEEADLFYQEGTPEVPFRSNQEWYATFTGEDGSRYAVTLEDEDTLALKFYLDGQESYLSLVNTVYFARQEAMG